MKKCLTLIFAVAALISAAVSLPEAWDASFCKIDEKTFLKGLNVSSSPQKIALSEKVLNLDTIAKGSDSAAIRGYIQSDKAQTVWLGIGCKLFSLSLNGKQIYDFREYGLGYDVTDVTVRDHIIPLELKAGRNELLFNTRRTNWKYDYVDISWMFDVGRILGVMDGKIRKTNGIYQGNNYPHPVSCCYRRYFGSCPRLCRSKVCR